VKMLVGISLLTLVLNLLLLLYLFNGGQGSRDIKRSGSGKISFTLTPQEEEILETDGDIVETEALFPNKN
jgi:hypothetical protein